MDISSYATVLPLVIICYLVGIGCKQCDRVADKHIPVILGVLGGVLAIPAMYVMPGFPATDVFTAVAVGIMSGLTSTGINQVYKQIGKDE